MGRQFHEPRSRLRLRHEFGVQAWEAPYVRHSDRLLEKFEHGRIIGRIAHEHDLSVCLGQVEPEALGEEAPRRRELVVLPEPAIDVD